MTSAGCVANFFIDLANNDEYGDGMTNMRLNKLLFFAQGHYYARTGQPLFNDDFEAWTYGPVVADIYRRYNLYGRHPIEKVDAGYTCKTFSPDELDLLLDVAREYGKYSTSELVKFTHTDDSPWASSYHSSASQAITKSQIKEYFMSLRKLETFDDLLLHSNIPLYDKRSDDGYLLLPRDDRDRARS